MFHKAFVITIALCSLSFNVHAKGIDFRLGSETAEITFLTQSTTFGYGGADMGFGVFWNENDDIIGSGSIMVTGSPAGDVRGLHFGVGGKAYVGVLDLLPEDAEGAAAAIGVQARYVFPSSTPMAILAEAYYAPNVTTVSDFDNLVEYRFAIELEVTPSAKGYIGYRKFEIELDPGGAEIEVDDKAHVGVRFSF